MKHRVYTESGSVHEYDTSTLTYVRLAAANDLRRDGEPLSLIGWTDPVVGEPWEVLIVVREDGIGTLRTTTPVVRVVEVEG